MSSSEEKKEPPKTETESIQQFDNETDGVLLPNERSLEKEFIPPDGGWGWVVCVTSLLTNGTIFSMLNTFGIIYVYLIKEYAKGDHSVAFKTSWVGSVCIGITFLMSIFAGICSDQIGIRPTAFFGAALGAIGLFSSAFVIQLELLYLTYGLLLGIGGGFIYSTSLVILGHYFQKHMGIVNGIVTFGSSVYTIVLSIVLPIVLKSFGIKYTFLFLGGLYCILLPCSLTWKPLFQRDTDISRVDVSSNKRLQGVECCNWAKKYLNLNIFKNHAYLTWFLGFGIALFGYFVPFVHLVKHTQDVFPKSNAYILITCMQATSGVGRIVFGKVADLKFINRIYMQQCAFVVTGFVTACIPFSASFEGLVAICLIMGLCDGISVCLLGPIAFDLVGPKNASQAIGFMLGGFSIPFTVGPPIAGLLYDHLHTYEIAFVAAGAPPIIGAIVMCFIPKKASPEAKEAHTSISMVDVYQANTDKSELELNVGVTDPIEDELHEEGKKLLESPNDDIIFRRNGSKSSNENIDNTPRQNSELCLNNGVTA
ncbi:monocarboxylate transporter 10-like [Saccostrea echinata]|uniref:monocarboxylate transporter 10-like n=1 Tax=Saccostrea echinata TaxID=191078 RepID=UPI002A83AB09|nr:monocarboxylate transporter 10-like [Saccostrea echinata]